MSEQIYNQNADSRTGQGQIYNNVNNPNYVSSNQNKFSQQQGNQISQQQGNQIQPYQGNPGNKSVPICDLISLVVRETLYQSQLYEREEREYQRGSLIYRIATSSTLWLIIANIIIGIILFAKIDDSK